MLLEMPPVFNASTTAALSLSARPAKSVRLGAAETVIQIKAATPSTPRKPSSGRLFATAGWARKLRTPCMTPPARAGAAALRAGMGVSSVAAISLILHRHAHDVLVGGQETVPDLQRRLEAERRLLARQHHRRDVGGLAAFIGLGHRRGAGLAFIDLVDRGAQRLAEA